MLHCGRSPASRAARPSWARAPGCAAASLAPPHPARPAPSRCAPPAPGRSCCGGGEEGEGGRLRRQARRRQDGPSGGRRAPCGIDVDGLAALGLARCCWHAGERAVRPGRLQAVREDEGPGLEGCCGQAATPPQEMCRSTRLQEARGRGRAGTQEDGGAGGGGGCASRSACAALQKTLCRATHITPAALHLCLHTLAGRQDACRHAHSNASRKRTHKTCLSPACPRSSCQQQ